MCSLVSRPAKTPIREGTSWRELWKGVDSGLIALCVLAFTYTAAFGAESSPELKETISNMESAERQFNERQSKVLVRFMSLETMFPDETARALARAAGRGNVRQIERLVNEGVDVNARGAQGATPLYWAMRNYRGFKRLLELGADPNIVYADGNSVMLSAAELKDHRVLEAALEHGGDPNLRSGDSLGETLIFRAANVGMDVVDILLKYGADIDARDNFGSTPVLTAAKIRHYELAYQLLQRRADYTLVDENGVDLAQLVAESVGKIQAGSKWEEWQLEVIDWLRQRGIEIPGVEN